MRNDYRFVAILCLFLLFRVLCLLNGLTLGENMSHKYRNLIIGYITVFMDVMGFSIVVPILPYLSASLGANSMQEGVLFSGYCFTQMISS